MPNTHSTLTSLFADIADAIREKDGSTAQIVADAFPAAVRAIPSGGEVIVKTGKYTVASNKTADTIKISHGLGSIPNIAIWIMDPITNYYSCDYAVFIDGINYVTSAGIDMYSGFGFCAEEENLSSPGKATIYTSVIPKDGTSRDLNLSSSVIDDTMFSYRYQTSIKAGTVVNWVAIKYADIEEVN